MSIGRGAPEDRIRVALLGFGRVGSGVLDLALTRPWVEVVAVLARRAERHGEPARLSVREAPDDLVVRTDVAVALAEVRPQVVIMATASRLPHVLEKLGDIRGCGARAVISTSEELAYALPGDGETAAAIHDLARLAGLVIVPTGVNPGFVLDLWPLILSGLAWDVDAVEARRVVDVSVFAPHTRTQLGIGHAPEAFAAGVADGSIAGHLGFRESLRLLCDRLGQPAERISIDTDPIVAESTYDLVDGSIERGTTVGASQRAVAWRDGKPWITVELLLHVAPAQDGIRTIDETHIRGRHELHATLEPGASAIKSTAALLINTIPVALDAAPGLHRPGDLPPSLPWLATTRPPSRLRPQSVVA